MESLWQDIRYGLRMLVRKPGFTAVAVLTLALGIGANVAIFTVIHGVLLRPLPFQEAEQLVTLSEKSREGSLRNVGYLTIADWRTESRTFDYIAAYRSWSPSLVGDGTPERLPGMRVSASFFSVLRTKPVLGRDFLPEEDRPENNRVVILSHGLWQRQFAGDPEIRGQTISLSGRAYTVVGVLPPDFQPVVSTLSYTPAEIWTPLAYDQSDQDACRSCRHLRSLGRLAAGVSLEQANSEITTITARLTQEYPDEYPGNGVAVVRLYDRVVGNVRPALLVLLGAVGFVLLIACANVANLLLVRAANREKEIAVRAALGAGRWRLLRQSFIESLLLAGAGGVAGLLLALWGVDMLLAMSPGNLPRLETVKVDGPVLAFALLASFVTGILFGVVPAWRVSRPDLNQVLKMGGRSGGETGSRQLRSLLVVVETALALVLLVGSALLLNSFIRLAGVNPGFDQKNLLTMNIQLSGAKYPEDLQALAVNREVAEKIGALPGVESVGWVSHLPLSGNFDRYGMPIEERPDLVSPNLPSVERYVVSLDYLHSMRIPLRKGRTFTGEDGPDSQQVVLINETLARHYWAGQNPVGKRIQMGRNIWRTIVGVVGDVRQYGLDVEPNMQAYIPQSQYVTYYNYWVVRVSSNPATLTDAIRNAVWVVDPAQPVVDIISMEQLSASTIAQRRFIMLLLGVFSAVALTLASIGLYGVISYSVAQRTHELGIRLALGAQRSNIFKLVVKQGVTLVFLGLTVGLAAAFWLTRFLSSLLFEVGATDPLTFIGVSLLLLFVGLLASYIPARRATKVDPMVALRYE